MNRHTKEKRHTIDRLLHDWDASIGDELYDKLRRLSERRAFLTGMARSGVALASIPLWAGMTACDRKTGQSQLTSEEPWRTFAAVQQQLFPADSNGPSARDLNATAYLSFVMQAADTDADDRKFLHDGIGWLNALTDKQFGKAFVMLTGQQQDEALKQIAQSNAGERWLSNLLLYILEALLTDPVYGGNPEGIGWQWLAHQPGFPRPPKDKRYTELL